MARKKIYNRAIAQICKSFTPIWCMVIRLSVGSFDLSGGHIISTDLHAFTCYYWCTTAISMQGRGFLWNGHLQIVKEVRLIFTMRLQENFRFKLKRALELAMWDVFEWWGDSWFLGVKIIEKIVSSDNSLIWSMCMSNRDFATKKHFNDIYSRSEIFS